MTGKKISLVLAVISLMLFSSVASAQQKSFILNKEGVGCLKKGTLLSKVPAKCEGLYDRVEKQKIEDEMDGDYVIYNFYRGKEKVIDISDYGAGTISSITAYASNISTPDGVSPGMLISKLLQIKGVKGVYRDGLGLELKGYSIGFGEMTDAGNEAFNKAYAAGTDVKLSNACFKQGAKVLYIGN